MRFQGSGRKAGAMAVAIALAGVGGAFASPFEVDSTSTAENIEVKCAFELRESSGDEKLTRPASRVSAIRSQTAQ